MLAYLLICLPILLSIYLSHAFKLDEEYAVKTNKRRKIYYPSIDEDSHGDHGSAGNHDDNNDDIDDNGNSSYNHIDINIENETEKEKETEKEHRKKIQSLFRHLLPKQSTDSNNNNYQDNINNRLIHESMHLQTIRNAERSIRIDVSNVPELKYPFLNGTYHHGDIDHRDIDGVGANSSSIPANANEDDYADRHHDDNGDDARKTYDIIMVFSVFHLNSTTHYSPKQYIEVHSTQSLKQLVDEVYCAHNIQIDGGTPDDDDDNNDDNRTDQRDGDDDHNKTEQVDSYRDGLFLFDGNTFYLNTMNDSRASNHNDDDDDLNDDGRVRKMSYQLVSSLKQWLRRYSKQINHNNSNNNNSSSSSSSRVDGRSSSATVNNKQQLKKLRWSTSNSNQVLTKTSIYRMHDISRQARKLLDNHRHSSSDDVDGGGDNAKDNDTDGNDNDNDSGIHFNTMDMSTVACNEAFRRIGQSLLYSHMHGCEHVLYLTNMKHVKSCRATIACIDGTDGTSDTQVSSSPSRMSYPRTIYRAIHRKKRYHHHHLHYHHHYTSIIIIIITTPPSSPSPMSTSSSLITDASCVTSSMRTS
jgi:hypothetical protein